MDGCVDGWMDDKFLKHIYPKAMLKKHTKRDSKPTKAINQQKTKSQKTQWELLLQVASWQGTIMQMISKW